MNISVVSHSVKSAAFTNCDTIQEFRGKGLALPQATLLFFLLNVEMREEMESQVKPPGENALVHYNLFFLVSENLK